MQPRAGIRSGFGAAEADSQSIHPFLEEVSS
jgi:hypothetical protein